MAITRVKVRNFKSFDELDVELRPLNIVVGGNAAGKSNFLEIFRFVRDLATQGIENAVSLQGGMEFLANLRLGENDTIFLEVELTDLGMVFNAAPILRAIHSVSLAKAATGAGFALEKERVDFELLMPDSTFQHHGLAIERKLDGAGWRVEGAGREGNFWKIFRHLVHPGETLFRFLSRSYAEIEVFDVDPRLSKRATSLTGRSDLDPDGNNLAIVLRLILQDEERRSTFVRLVREALPFVEDFKVERFSDKSLIIALREVFSGQTYLPAAFLSDGTIHLIALIVALYFDQSEITIIEEPERNIHPHLISKVAAMLKDASRQKQVIVTTHNPELVKHADLEDLLLVQRDERGFSRISRPAESEQLKVFLENDLGVDELYVQNLLGVGHGV